MKLFGVHPEHYPDESPDFVAFFTSKHSAEAFIRQFCDSHLQLTVLTNKLNPLTARLKIGFKPFYPNGYEITRYTSDSIREAAWKLTEL